MRALNRNVERTFSSSRKDTQWGRFKAYLAPLYRTKWFVYSKRPFAGPEQVLSYLSRYTHRVAISNRRLLCADENGVTFNYKDYRIEGPVRYID